MKLAFDNLSFNAALMVLSYHVAMDLESVSDSHSLLSGSTSIFFFASRVPDRE